MENLHRPQSVVVIYHCVEPPKRTITENIFGKSSNLLDVNSHKLTRFLFEEISFAEYEKQMGQKKAQGKELVEKYQEKLNEFKVVLFKT